MFGIHDLLGAVGFAGNAVGVPGAVVCTFIREKYELVHVTVGEEEIETTVEHPFYVEDVGFVPAGKLRAGDIIRTADKRNLPVTKVESEEL